MPNRLVLLTAILALNVSLYGQDSSPKMVYIAKNSGNPYFQPLIEGFKKAAEELNLTPSAVSHGVQTLEDWLRVPLFMRSHRSLVLTGAGAAYLPQVRAALENLARATEAVPGRAPSGRLSISVAPTFGMRWLERRTAVPGFIGAAPQPVATH